jgi:hypothetical protein
MTDSNPNQPNPAECGTGSAPCHRENGGQVMKSYHFYAGAPRDPINFSADVRAGTPEEALRILRNVLGDNGGYFILDVGDEIEGVDVYFDSNAITLDNIQEADECDD